jgi:hypothetical protein
MNLQLCSFNIATANSYRDKLHKLKIVVIVGKQNNNLGQKQILL